MVLAGCGAGPPDGADAAAERDAGIDAAPVGECWPGSSQSCDDPPPGGIGTCARGYRTCGPEGWSACEQGTPRAEWCNGWDDDCDGEVDDEGVADIVRCLGAGCAEPFAPDPEHARGVALDGDGALILSGPEAGEYRWTFVACDDFIYSGADWCNVSWSGSTPGASRISIELRGEAEGSGPLREAPWQELASSDTDRSPEGIEDSGCWGPQRAEVRVVLSPNLDGASPRLKSLALTWDCILCE